MFCKLVKASDNHLYKKEFNLMQQYAPEMLSRKIYSSLHQSAQVLHHVLNNAAITDTLLSAGAYEDMPTEVLEKMGYNVIKIDPVLNMDLHTYRAQNPSLRVDVIFSTSVIEHVPGDLQFIVDICDMLKPGGLCVMTCDFKPGYKEGDPMPATCERLYTKSRLQGLMAWIEGTGGCKMTEEPQWDIQESDLDFTWDGVDYCFVGISFRKDL